jgi:murein DD-endopeptidase MepM/ murein hydrolase activator NlpD
MVAIKTVSLSKNNSWPWIYPLVKSKKPTTLGNANHPGSFAVVRKYDVHTGIDLYCELNEEVIACEDGEVVKIENFTGENANPPSSWWNETQAVLIEGKLSVLVYGEIKPIEGLKVGDFVKAGQVIGNVQTVLKKDKGKPMTMLHFEMYQKGARETVVWNLGEERPETLLNPTINLICSRYKNE